MQFLQSYSFILIPTAFLCSSLSIGRPAGGACSAPRERSDRNSFYRTLFCHLAFNYEKTCSGLHFSLSSDALIRPGPGMTLAFYWLEFSPTRLQRLWTSVLIQKEYYRYKTWWYLTIVKTPGRNWDEATPSPQRIVLAQENKSHNSFTNRRKTWQVLFFHISVNNLEDRCCIKSITWCF